MRGSKVLDDRFRPGQVESVRYLARTWIVALRTLGHQLGFVY